MGWLSQGDCARAAMELQEGCMWRSILVLLPKAAIESPSLERVKSCADVVWRDMV